MGLKRPAWTVCFGLIWLTVIPGVLLTHLSVSALIPHISDLPANVIKGFDEVFKFAYLAADAANVKNSAAAAVGLCQSLDAATVCPGDTYPDPSTMIGTTVVVTTQRAAINAAFANSLTVVQKVTNDKYLGTEELAATAQDLNKVIVEMGKVSDSMTCAAAVPSFCAIYKSGEAMVQGMDVVNKGIDKMRNNDMISRWDDYKSLLIVLHALPYFTVCCLLTFSFFIYKGGVCCCCKDGTKVGTLALLPFILFWLASFVIWAIVLGAGMALTYGKDSVSVSVLKGKPTLGEVVAHIETVYPAFWKTVFADLVDGLSMLMNASFFLVAVNLVVIIYSLLECCCCPYRTKYGEEQQA